jgi:hypothetical protein
MHKGHWPPLISYGNQFELSGDWQCCRKRKNSKQEEKDEEEEQQEKE